MIIFASGKRRQYRRRPGERLYLRPVCDNCHVAIYIVPLEDTDAPPWLCEQCGWRFQAPQ
jgi:hypothetical protein